MPRKNKKQASLAEQKDGVNVVQVKGRDHFEKVETKIGSDGIIETHVGYSLVPRPKWGKPTERYCTRCKKWHKTGKDRR